MMHKFGFFFEAKNLLSVVGKVSIWRGECVLVLFLAVVKVTFYFVEVFVCLRCC